MAWQILVDRGGTFTDVVARDPDGRLHVRKLLSRAPDYVNATVHALEEHARAGAGLSGADAEAHAVEELRLGTTVATNALLERRGEPLLLITTRGFADLLAIGSQERPDLFALRIEKRALLHARVEEIHERVLADGSVRRAPRETEVRAALRRGRAQGLRSVAVLLLHAPIHPAHELLVGRLAREEGYLHVALGHEVSPEPGAVARGDTTTADAYLTPLLRRHLAAVAAAAPDARLGFMQSSGGLADPGLVSGKDAILSGPAGGVLAVAHVAKRLGLGAVIGLDMGGTSTDVCRCAPEPEREYETQAGGVRLRAPMLRVVTVAAGGGSLLRVADGRFGVGPDSAGADPGPACYGRGGPATLTDANLVLGRIRAEHFPHLALDTGAAHAALSAFGEPVRAAEGFVAVANENMAAAIRAISVARGHDARDDALCCFGGAGGQHACALARLLGMRRVVVHPLAGVLSAFGLGLADVSHHAVAPVADPSTRSPAFPDEQAQRALAAQGFDEVVLQRSVDARYAGTDHALTIPWSDDWETLFTERHREQFGFVKAGHPVELVAARVTAVGRAGRLQEDEAPAEHHRPEPDVGPTVDDPVAVYRRDALRPGAEFAGPALVVEDHATTWVEPGWTVRVDERRWLILEHVDDARVAAASAGPTPPALVSDARRDPVGLEVMGNRFMALATQMGEHLRRVAHSTNIKERLDYSCALFDAEGGLIANAPHIPVHLGAMGETVRALLAERRMREGDVWLSNDPFRGGSHLPDLTVITPVFREGRLAFLVANRGHHADVGGPTPGSMPTDSRELADEGVLFSNVLLVRDGAFREAEITEQMRAAGVRGIPDRLADLAAQVASNAAGARGLHELCDSLGTGIVQAWMGHVRDNAAEVMGDVLRTLLDGRPSRTFRFEDGLDDGTRLCVSIEVTAGGDGPHAQPHARIDFAGCSPQHPGNRNAPRAVAVAAVLYVFRTLAARPIPLNAGCLLPLEIVIPPGCLLDPQPPAAVCGGNVETSQRIVDVLYGALGTLAAAQGTMNNLSFGDDSFGYYETVCGGAGAGFGFDGASAVHTHMTNTRITDPEVLERRHPVVLREFAIRRGSGGRGVWHGGDGVVRDYEFLRPLRASVLAERRTTAPFGLRAGPGARGEHDVTARSVRMLTPGGGGYTPTPAEWAAMEADSARDLFRRDRWRGPTAGIAEGCVHAHLAVVRATDLEAVLAHVRAARARVIWRGPPGEHVLHDGARIDLATDVPLYVDEDGARVPCISWRADDVGLLLDRHVALGPGPHRHNAPGRALLLRRLP
ncbi:MAG: hydantoinase B/oxoprolinase family protein [Planctomycetota bacterium]